MSEATEIATVQDVIDRLLTVEDKTQPFMVQVFGKDGVAMDYSHYEINEYTDESGEYPDVELSVYFE